jgi:hypothetical protein
MQINLLTTAQWHALPNGGSELTDRIENNEVFIVRGFMDEDLVDRFKGFCLDFSRDRDASWHPCLDGCPDYHRIHDNYAGAYVPSVQHGYYFHSWNEHFSKLNSFAGFGEVFDLKRNTGGLNDDSFMTNLPSQGPVARLVCHQYPRGGGGQSEHIDPVSPFAKVQTIIQASQPGVDYQIGGLYINDPDLGIVNLDPLTRKGDLILASPGVRHGVAPIDPDEPIDWGRADGRWIIMPIIIHSDHVKDPSVRPMKTAAT